MRLCAVVFAFIGLCGWFPGLRWFRIEASHEAENALQGHCSETAFGKDGLRFDFETETGKPRPSAFTLSRQQSAPGSGVATPPTDVGASFCECFSFGVMYERGKITEKMRNQFRSWSIMEEYFGIKQPGAIYLPFNWRDILPPDQIKAMDGLIAKSKEIQRERALLN